MDDLCRKEYELWQEICKQLSDLKVVTKEDLKKTKGDESTPGSKLLTLIAKWGNANVRLHQQR